MPGAMLNGCSEQSTQRNATDERNVRHQDLLKSSLFPDGAEPVDKGKSGFYMIGRNLVFGVRKGVER